MRPHCTHDIMIHTSCIVGCIMHHASWDASCIMHHASCSELGARSSEQRELGLGARACSELGVSEIGHRTRPASTHITAKTKNKTSYIIDDDISCSTPGATATGYKIMINKRECPSLQSRRHCPRVGCFIYLIITKTAVSAGNANAQHKTNTQT